MQSGVARLVPSHACVKKGNKASGLHGTCRGRHNVETSCVWRPRGAVPKKRWESAPSVSGSRGWAPCWNVKAGMSATIVACIVGAGQASAIEEQEVLEAQDLWASGVVRVGSMNTWEESRDAASELIRDLYAYETTRVLFKPTLARQIPFRHTFDGALSYFVGRNDEYPEDQGFALRPWSNIAFQNSGVLVYDDVAMASGVYALTDTQGGQTDAEYTFVYQKQKDGKLRIIVHHSSIPFGG